MNCVLETLATTVSGAESKTFSNSTLFRFTWHHDLSVCLRPSLNRPQQSASTIGLNYNRVLLLLPLLLFPLLLLLLLLLMLLLLQLLLLPLLLLTLLLRFQKFERGCEAAIFAEPRARSRKDDFTADRAASDCKK